MPEVQVVAIISSRFGRSRCSYLNLGNYEFLKVTCLQNIQLIEVEQRPKQTNKQKHLNIPIWQRKDEIHKVVPD